MDPHSKMQNFVEILSWIHKEHCGNIWVNSEFLASAPVKLRRPKCGFQRVLKTFKSSDTT